MAPDIPALFDAICQGDEASVRAALKQHPDLLRATNPKSFGATVLNAAVGADDTHMVDVLLDCGADIDQLSDWAFGPWSPLQLALNGGRTHMAEHLATRGARLGPHEAAGLGRLDHLAQMPDVIVSERGGDGCLPLHFAKNAEVVEHLLERGADIEARDIDHDSTAAQYLCLYYPAATRALFAHSAQADVFSAAAAGDRQTIEALLATDPNALTAIITEETLPATKGHMNILHFTIGTGCTPLHAAAITDQAETVKAFVAAGLDPNARGGYDNATCLHVAAWRGSCAAASELITGGAEINARSFPTHNNTPLGWAVVAGQVEMVRLLLEKGATILDHFQADAKTGLEGGFRCYSTGKPEAFAAIRDLLLASL